MTDKDDVVASLVASLYGQGAPVSFAERGIGKMHGDQALALFACDRCLAIVGGHDRAPHAKWHDVMDAVMVFLRDHVTPALFGDES